MDAVVVVNDAVVGINDTVGVINGNRQRRRFILK